MNVCLYMFISVCLYSCMYIYTYVRMYAETSMYEYTYKYMKVCKHKILRALRFPKFLLYLIVDWSKVYVYMSGIFKSHIQYSRCLTPFCYFFLPGRLANQSPPESGLSCQIFLFPFIRPEYSSAHLMFSVTQRNITLSLCKSSCTWPHR